jgi:hypothetical protein
VFLAQLKGLSCSGHLFFSSVSDPCENSAFHTQGVTGSSPVASTMFTISDLQPADRLVATPSGNMRPKIHVC